MRRILAFVLAITLAYTTPLSAQQAPPASFADLAEKLSPAVVNISTTARVNVNAEDLQGFMPDMPEFPEGSPFNDFFKDFMEKHKEALPKNRKVNAMGSGFIVDPKGYVVTNNHVVQGAEEVTVILQDNTNLKAKIVGKDKKTDLALLKVETSKPLPAVGWGNSDKMRVGDWILAIGNPFGLGGTVTAGIISARARDINSGPYDDYLQTDASINRGNSGGPMFNLAGEVIGVNTAIFSPTGGSIGIGFAIPSSLAQGVIAQLKDHGYTKRGWIGVKIQNVTEDIAQNLGLPKAQGALVSSVDKSGPAKNSGLKTGDVIMTFDGKEVNEMRRLPRIVAETPINKEVDLNVWRDGKTIQLKTKIGELPNKDEEDEPVTTSDGGKGKDKPTEQTPIAETKVSDLGIGIASLTPALRKKYKLNDASKGLVITSVDQDSAAAETGMAEGDVIVEVNQAPATKTADVVTAAKAAKDRKKPLLLLLESNGDQRFVAIQLP